MALKTPMRRKAPWRHRLPSAMRVDKWLWHARFFKTRTLATKLAAAGNIRINGQKQSRASASIRIGDVLTFPLNRHIRLIEVVALSTRRGPAAKRKRSILTATRRK